MVSNDSKCLIQREMAEKKFGGGWQFSVVAAIPQPFLHSSLINLVKATAIPNFIAVT